jgi:hypothetical protein
MMMRVNDVPMVATVISTNGSARTAKLAAVREVKRIFRTSEGGVMSTSSNSNNDIQERLMKLEEQIEQVHCVD